MCAGVRGVQGDQPQAVREAQLHRGAERDARVDEGRAGDAGRAPGAHRQGHGRLRPHRGVLLQPPAGRLQRQVSCGTLRELCFLDGFKFISRASILIS